MCRIIVTVDEDAEIESIAPRQYISAAVSSVSEASAEFLASLVPSSDDLRAHLFSGASISSSACLDRASVICDDVSNVLDRYEVTRRLGGGKSGALVMFVKERRSFFSRFYAVEPEERVLKVYPNTFKDGEVINERPLREISVLCEMNGTSGFPTVFETGCALWGAERCPYVIINKMSGVVLTRLAISSLTPQVRLGIALQLLRLLGEARDKLGEKFQHFDLHPDNIFVDTEHCVELPYLMYGFKFRCPTVSIIDFDLVHSEKFLSTRSFSRDLLPEQVAKLTGPVTIPERTINFALKWLGPSRTSDLLLKLRLVKYSTDIRNWLAIFAALVGDIGDGSFHLCDDPHECVEANRSYFIQFLEIDPDERARAVAFEPRESIELNRRAQNFSMPFDFLKQFIKNTAFTREIDQFFDESRAKSGFYPVLDNILIGANIERDSPFVIRFTSQDHNLLDISLKGIKVAFAFKEMKPQIRVDFDSFNISVSTFIVMEQLLVTIMKAISGNNDGKTISQSLEQFFGAIEAKVEDGVLDAPVLKIRNLRLTFDGPFVFIKGTFESSRVYSAVLSSALRIKETISSFGFLTELNFDIHDNIDGSFTFSAKQSLEGPKHPCVEFAEHLDEYIAGDSTRYDICVNVLTSTTTAISEPYLQYRTQIQTAIHGFRFEMFLEHVDEDFTVLHHHSIDYKKYAYDFIRAAIEEQSRSAMDPRYQVLFDAARRGSVGPLDVLNILYSVM